jgi:hypothetical protein
VKLIAWRVEPRNGLKLSHDKNKEERQRPEERSNNRMNTQEKKKPGGQRSAHLFQGRAIDTLCGRCREGIKRMDGHTHQGSRHLWRTRPLTQGEEQKEETKK